MARSHQANYQASLRVIKSRTGASHKEAQAVYRFQRDKLGPKIPPSKFEGYSQSHITRVRREAVREESQPLFTGTDAAFDLRRLASEGQVPGISAKDTALLTVTFGPFIAGQKKSDITVSRRNVKKADFWRVYHDMAREAIDRTAKKARKSPDALLVRSMSIL